jgi:menaquinone-dependent protoporphyrinogen oxidase
VDDEGRDVLVASEPKEFAELREALHPRDAHVFFGAWDPDAPPANVAERIFRMMPVSRDLLPVGDFRDWPAIEAWADSIAADLGAAVPAAR